MRAFLISSFLNGSCEGVVPRARRARSCFCFSKRSELERPEPKPELQWQATSSPKLETSHWSRGCCDLFNGQHYFKSFQYIFFASNRRLSHSPDSDEPGLSPPTQDSIFLRTNSSFLYFLFSFLQFWQARHQILPFCRNCLYSELKCLFIILQSMVVSK